MVADAGLAIDGFGEGDGVEGVVFVLPAHGGEGGDHEGVGEALGLGGGDGVVAAEFQGAAAEGGGELVGDVWVHGV